MKDLENELGLRVINHTLFKELNDLGLLYQAIPIAEGARARVDER